MSTGTQERSTRRAAAEAAAIRLTLANRRAAWAAQGLRAGGRGAGRLARDIPALGSLDPADPALVPIVDPARGERVIAAAAAALAARPLLRAITAADRAAADALVSPEARAFAVRHRHLALPDDGAPLDRVLTRARALASADWRARLPSSLAAECPDHPASDAEPLPAPLPPPADDEAPAAEPRTPPALWAAFQALSRRRRVALPTAAFVPAPARPAAALTLALAEIAPLPPASSPPASAPASASAPAPAAGPAA